MMRSGNFISATPTGLYRLQCCPPKEEKEAYREAERTLEGGFAGIGELAMYHGGWSLSDFEDLDPSLKLGKRPMCR